MCQSTLVNVVLHNARVRNQVKWIKVLKLVSLPSRCFKVLQCLPHGVNLTMDYVSASSLVQMQSRLSADRQGRCADPIECVRLSLLPNQAKTKDPVDPASKRCRVLCAMLICRVRLRRAWSSGENVRLTNTHRRRQTSMSTPTAIQNTRVGAQQVI